MLFEIHCFVYCAAGCAVNNGGCEHRCVRGNPNRCTCNAGFILSLNQRDCVGKHMLPLLTVWVLSVRSVI